MVIRRCIIAFSLLMSIIIAVNALSTISTDPEKYVNDTEDARRTFNITVGETANFTWYLNRSFLKTENMATTSYYTNESAALGYWNVTVNAVAVSGNGSQRYTWWWRVTPASPGAPNITSYFPLNRTPSSYFGTRQVFNATANQTARFTWLINDSQVQLNRSVDAGTTVTYVNNRTAGIGTHNVTVVVNNSYGKVSRTWLWSVENPPDTTPPASVTNLSLIENGTTWLLINWTNPSDRDFDHVMVYRNSTFAGNTTSNSSHSYNITGLNSGTMYKIAVKTVDTSGNINQTGAELMANTDPNTPVSDVPITVTLQNSSVTFTRVTVKGNTVETSDTSHLLPSGYTAVSYYLNISTTARYEPPVTVRVKYRSSLLPQGYTASDIRLFHWNNSRSEWDNVTTSVDTDNSEVIGVLSDLSDFVDGVYPKPVITKIEPKETNIETIGTASKTFRITVNQTSNVTWYIDSNLTKNSGQVLANVEVNYTYTPPRSGKYNVSVTATNITTGYSNSTYWNLTVRPKTYETGNRIWDASKEMSLTYTWNPMSFYAFYYNLNSNVGNEALKIMLDDREDRNIQEDTLVYSTVPENVSFDYGEWGRYNVIGFMAEKYFAAYTAATSHEITGSRISVLNNKQLHRILMDDDTRRAVYAGSTLTLSEGYVLKVKDVDITGGKIVLLSLLKDGSEVDTTAVQAGGTYVYTKKVGTVSELPIIAVHIDTVFAGREANAAFMKGIFQISESFISVNNGNRYGIMEITGASDTGITMANKNSLSLSPGSVNDVMGEIKIIVADNSSVLRFAPMVKRAGTYEVRGTVSQDIDANFDWNPLNFEGFYYNINEDVGSEKLSLTRSDRSVGAKKLVYTTTPQSVSFTYNDFGSYKVVGFMADKYFAGYTSNSTGITSTAISTINSKQLHKVLTDDDARRAVYAGSTLTLSEGYVLKVKDVDITGGKIVLLSLLKDGNEVDTTAIEAGKTYVYTKKVGTVSELPIIAVHIDTVFAGREANAAFMKGIFQISESYTSVNQGDDYGIMEITQVSDTSIEMKNPSSLSLSQASTIDVMGKIKFKVADSGEVRFYPFIMVNGSANQLSIDAPSNPTVRDMITIAVTAGGTSVSGAAVSFDSTEIGTTNLTGKLDYMLTSSGTHNITVTKLGYEKGVKTIQVSGYVENRLSIEVPAIIDQGVEISIKVYSNGTAIDGAAITFDGSAIGVTDAQGILNYSFNASGTHNIGASKEKYISAVREISIRMPFSEYKALDINITPSAVFTNEQAVIRSNITNAGTKADIKPVELIVNGTVEDNRTVVLAPGEIKEINFTYKEALPGNYTVEILGQKGLLEVKEKPLNYLLIGAIVTIIGAIAIYLITSKRPRRQNERSAETINKTN